MGDTPVARWLTYVTLVVLAAGSFVVYERRVPFVSWLIGQVLPYTCVWTTVAVRRGWRPKRWR
jgi:hypothetical protein